MVKLRAASAADAAAVAAVQRASWFAAYAGIIEEPVIDRVTAPDGGARVRQTFRTRPWQRMIVADDPVRGVVGFASFGPERDVVGRPWPYPVTEAGAAGEIAELYALYVHPDWWSTGTGRALTTRVLDRVRRGGYRVVTLWVLEANARARRFYERAGFAADGAVNTLHDLGGVAEIRYRRQLRLFPLISGYFRTPAPAEADPAVPLAPSWWREYTADFSRGMVASTRPVRRAA
jgi:GNAT superfamily N-acetyltransferase